MIANKAIKAAIAVVAIAVLVVSGEGARRPVVTRLEVTAVTEVA